MIEVVWGVERTGEYVERCGVVLVVQVVKERKGRGRRRGEGGAGVEGGGRGEGGGEGGGGGGEGGRGGGGGGERGREGGRERGRGRERERGRESESESEREICLVIVISRCIECARHNGRLAILCLSCQLCRATLFCCNSIVGLAN